MTPPTSAWGRRPRPSSAAGPSSSAFPDLAASQQVSQTRRSRAARAAWSDAPASSFNPYPSRVEEMNARASQWRRTGQAPHSDLVPELVLDRHDSLESHTSRQAYASIVVRDKTAPAGASSGGAWASMFHARRTGTAASRTILQSIRAAELRQHRPPPLFNDTLDPANDNIHRAIHTFTSRDTDDERHEAQIALAACLFDVAASCPSAPDVLASLEGSAHVSRTCTEALASSVDASISPYVRVYDRERLTRIVDALTEALSWHVGAHGADTVPESLVYALSCLYDANAHRTDPLARSRFYVAATELPSIVPAYAAWLQGASNICALPWSLTLGAKAQILAWEAQSAMREASSEAWSQSAASWPECGTWPIQVSRATIVEDSFKAFSLASPGMLHRPLRVTFRDEPAQDAGGLRKEWLQVLCDTLQQQAPWFDLSQANEPQMHGLLYLHHTCTDKEIHAAELLGMAVGLALFHQVTVPLRFAPALYVMLLAMAQGHAPPCTLDTLAQLKPDLAQGLERLLHADAAEVEGMHLAWHIDTPHGPHDLRPRGSETGPVQASEREAYVARLCAYTLLESVQAPLEALAHGFASVVAPASDRSPLALLTPHELATQLCGREEHTLDVEALRAHTDLVGFPDRDAAGAKRIFANLEAFWHVWSTLAPDEQHALLGFITGCARVPALGVRSLGLRIQHIELDPMQAARVPWSSTCTSTLFLPVYASTSELHAKIRIVVRHCTGFGLA